MVDWAEIKLEPSSMISCDVYSDGYDLSLLVNLTDDTVSVSTTSFISSYTIPRVSTCTTTSSVSLLAPESSAEKFVIVPVFWRLTKFGESPK